MECTELFEKIDELNEKYISVWEDICNIESPTDHKPGLDSIGEYFIDMAKKLGWKTEVCKQEKSGNVVCITANPDADENPISLCGHIDTVHPVGSFGTPAVRREGNKMYGPGVMDCKGGVVAAFFAMDALEKTGFEKRPVKLFLQTDEECNSMLSGKSTIEYILDGAKDSIAFINCESSRKGTAVLLRKGIIRYRFTVAGKGIHSSRCNEGASAIADAAYRILELEKLKDADGITCNCGLISGGTAANTVPDKCEFEFDIRFSDSRQLEFIKDHISHISQKTYIPGCVCAFEQTGFRPAMEKSGLNDALLDRMNEIYEKNGMPILKKRKSLGGSDAADVTSFGIPCVDSVGVEGDFIHTPDEFAFVDSLAAAAKRIAAVVYCI